MLYFDLIISVYHFWTAWLYLATGTMYQFETISRGCYNCGIYFPALFLYLLSNPFKIDGAFVCLSFAVNIAKLSNINADEFISFFFFYVQNEVLCTKLIIVFSLGNNFPIVLSEEVWGLFICLQSMKVTTDKIQKKTTLNSTMKQNGLNLTKTSTDKNVTSYYYYL
jgi:hypothetical protein